MPPKLKGGLLGDWEIAFAADEASAAALTTGAATGPFRKLEAVFVRLTSRGGGGGGGGGGGLAVRAVEVARRVGPFGNEKRALNGKWSLSPKTRQLSFKLLRIDDERGRDERLPSARNLNFQIVHLSQKGRDKVLVLRLETGGEGGGVGGGGVGEGVGEGVVDGVLVLKRMPKGQELDKQLRAYGVALEDETLS